MDPGVQAPLEAETISAVPFCHTVDGQNPALPIIRNIP